MDGQNHKRNKTEVIDENINKARKEFIVKSNTQPFRILPQKIHKDKSKELMKRSLELPIVGLINKDRLNKRAPLI